MNDDVEERSFQFGGKIEAEEAIIIPCIEVRLSPIIEKLMTFAWYPEDEVFFSAKHHEPGETIVLNSKGEATKKPVFLI